MPKATKRERQRQNRDARREAMVAAEKRRRQVRTGLIVGVVVLVIAAVVALQALRSDDDSDSNAASAVTCTDRTPSSPPPTETYDAAPPMAVEPGATYEVRMNTSCGDIPITLASEQAPQTVNSFLFLAQQGFFDGTTFHRIVTDFVDQGGDPTGSGNGDPGYSLPDEPPSGAYEVGDVAMANSGPGTSGSQFFLVVSQQGADTLSAQGSPGKYSILGKMSPAGLRVAKKINTFGSSDEAGTPTRDIYVFDIAVTTPT